MSLFCGYKFSATGGIEKLKSMKMLPLIWGRKIYRYAICEKWQFQMLILYLLLYCTNGFVFASLFSWFFERKLMEKLMRHFIKLIDPKWNPSGFSSMVVVFIEA